MDREARKRDVETSNKRVTTVLNYGEQEDRGTRYFTDYSKIEVNVRMEGLKI